MNPWIFFHKTRTPIDGTSVYNDFLQDKGIQKQAKNAFLLRDNNASLKSIAYSIFLRFSGWSNLSRDTSGPFTKREA